MKLFLEWDRDDLVKTHIFNGEEDFKTHELDNLMEMALIQNRPKFVELLLEMGLNLQSFVTIRRLLYFYNCNKVFIINYITSFD